MLEAIKELKEQNFSSILTTSELDEAVANLRQLGFISTPEHNYHKFESDVNISVIDEPSKLEEISKLANSCLPDNPDATNNIYWKNLLDDNGAIYVSISDGIHAGYFRMYVGQKTDGSDLILFEDTLRVNRRPDLPATSVAYRQEFKAVVLTSLKQMGFTDSAYVSTPFKKDISYQGEPLLLTKVGSTNFKKRFFSSFYEGLLDEDKAPKFAKVSNLLNL